MDSLGRIQPARGGRAECVRRVRGPRRFRSCWPSCATRSGWSRSIRQLYLDEDVALEMRRRVVARLSRRRLGRHAHDGRAARPARNDPEICRSDRRIPRPHRPDDPGRGYATARPLAHHRIPRELEGVAHSMAAPTLRDLPAVHARSSIDPSWPSVWRGWDGRRLAAPSGGPSSTCGNGRSG